MLASLVGLAPRIVARMTRRDRMRLGVYGVSAVASVWATFLGLGELFRATLGVASGLLAGLFLAALHLFVLRIVVAGGGMSLAVGRREAALWRAGKGTLVLLALIGAFAAQGVVVLFLERPLSASVAEHREVLLEVRSQGVRARFDALELALEDERELFLRTSKPSKVHALYTEEARRAILATFDRKKVALDDRRRAAERDVRLYREHLWTREFEGRRILEAWRVHTSTAAWGTLALTCVAALPALLRLFFRSAFASYYAKRWELDRRLVAADFARTMHLVDAALAANLRRVRDDAPAPRRAPSPYADPAFAAGLRAGYGLIDGRVIDTIHATAARGRRE